MRCQWKESVNCWSPSTVKVCEMVPSKPCNSGRQEASLPALPACWGCSTPAMNDLTEVGLGHHLPAFHATSTIPALGVGLILSCSTFQDRESIHSAVGWIFIFFLRWKRALTAVRRKSCRASLQQQLVQLPPSPSCSLTKALLLRTEELPPPVKVLLPAQEADSRVRGTEKAEFSESQAYLLSLRLWQEVWNQGSKQDPG